ncbi:MAG: GFA family protein [Pseudomonadota bacterium]|nr:GFA family protein [Pseudomonadota bacterium]
MTTTTLTGSCLCGNVRYQASGCFNHFFLCHCQRCQKGSGSAHAANLFAGDGELQWLSGADQVRVFRLAETRHMRSFCRECGSALPFVQTEDNLLVLPAGSLDTPPPRSPEAHLFVASRAPWDSALPALPTFPGLPGA